MAKRCPTCGHSNDDSRIFCGSCGDPLDADLRLIQELEKRKHQVTETAERKRYEDDEEYVAPIKKEAKKEKKSALPIILVALVIVAAAAWFFLK